MDISQAATGVTLHIVPKGSSDDRFCTDNTYQPDTSDCEAGEWQWGSFTISGLTIATPIRTFVDLTYMQELSPESCVAATISDTGSLPTSAMKNILGRQTAR